MYSRKYEKLTDQGVGRFMEEDNYFVAWSPTHDAPALSITVPFNKQEATVGNGVMVALYMETPEKVNAFYQKALELGGTDEGKTGFRPAEASKGFYAGYFCDLAGKVECILSG